LTIDFFRKEHEELKKNIEEIVNIKLGNLSEIVKQQRTDQKEAIQGF
jgi:hypothetical protein